MANTKAPETAKYVSKYRNLTIAIRSSFYKTNADDGKRELVQGLRVVFRDGFFETNEAELIEKLEARPDFKTAFLRVPKNKTTDEMREQMRSLDEKERELKDREADLARREKLLKEAEDGRGSGSDADGDDEDLPVVSDKLKRAELEEIARAEGISDEDIENAELKSDLVAVIEAKRADAADKGDKEGGEFN